MTTGGKVAVGVGAAALAGGVIYWAWNRRQAMLKEQGAFAPAPVGINSIYSLAGAAVSAMGVPLSSAAMVGGVPLQIGSGARASVQPLGGSFASASFAAAAAMAAGAMPAPAVGMVTGATVETRSGRGHF